MLRQKSKIYTWSWIYVTFDPIVVLTYVNVIGYIYTCIALKLFIKFTSIISLAHTLYDFSVKKIKL